MSNKLIAYFTASGVTRRAAETLAFAAGADMIEIIPETRYTAADLDWRNPESRSTLEMKDPDCRPVIVPAALDMAQYDVVFIGFPVWWGREPSVVDSFLDAHDFRGKRVIPFCTSGGGGMGAASQRMQALLGADTTVEEGKELTGMTSEDVQRWVSGLEM